MKEPILETNDTIKAELNTLKKRYDTVVSSYFDASDYGYIGKGWPTNYILVGLTVTLDDVSQETLNETYNDMIALFGKVHKESGRKKTFYCLVLKRQDEKYSVASFIESDFLFCDTYVKFKEINNLLFCLSDGNPQFNALYQTERYAIISFSIKSDRILATPWEQPFDFGEHFILKNTCFYVDDYKPAYFGAAAMFLGNIFFIDSQLQRAIEQWLISSQTDTSGTALFNIACAYSYLGQMDSAFEFCKKAVESNVDRDLLLYDSDLDQFRKHPLYQKILAMV